MGGSGWDGGASRGSGILLDTDSTGPPDRILPSLVDGRPPRAVRMLERSRKRPPALVAQRIRASDYGSEGREFESLQARPTTSRPQGRLFCRRFRRSLAPATRTGQRLRGREGRSPWSTDAVAAARSEHGCARGSDGQGAGRGTSCRGEGGWWRRPAASPPLAAKQLLTAPGAVRWRQGEAPGAVASPPASADQGLQPGGRSRTDAQPGFAAVARQLRGRRGPQPRPVLNQRARSQGRSRLDRPLMGGGGPDEATMRRIPTIGEPLTSCHVGSDQRPPEQR